MLEGFFGNLIFAIFARMILNVIIIPCAHAAK